MPTLTTANLIELNPQALVGKGLHRECFVHPTDPRRCIKVVVSGSGNENRREQRYYAELSKKGVSWDMLPKFYGLVETNLGEGAVFDLVRDYDGCISLTLRHYLNAEAVTSANAAVLKQALQALKHYLLEHRIITMTLKPKNILLQKVSAENGKLVIVDNIGNSDFIPLAKYSAVFARRKILRKWRRFEDSIRSDFKDNVAVKELF